MYENAAVETIKLSVANNKFIFLIVTNAVKGQSLTDGSRTADFS